MMAFLPLVLLPIVEIIVFRSRTFLEMVWGRVGATPIFDSGDLGDFIDQDNFEINEEVISVLSHLDISRFLTTPSTWAGIIVCGLLCFGAIYIRRFRDES